MDDTTGAGGNASVDDSLIIQFQFLTPHPKRRSRPVPPQTRSVLPALTKLHFQGISEYLEVLAARIDAPLLRFDRPKIVFFNQLVFDIPQTIRFFGHVTRAHALTGESAADVLPSLHSLCIVSHNLLCLIDHVDTAPQGTQSFVFARHHCGHPVVVFRN
jgi:hypothetical protein